MLNADERKATLPQRLQDLADYATEGPKSEMVWDMARLMREAAIEIQFGPDPQLLAMLKDMLALYDAKSADPMKTYDPVQIVAMARAVIATAEGE